MPINAANAVNTDIDPEQRRLLLIDDDIDFAIANAEFLEEFGYQVIVAHDSHQATESIAKFDAQIALIDINLGNTSGIDLLPELRQLSPDLICIMLTGNADMESAIEALRLGANDYLRKPVNLEELLAVLERCTKTWKLQKEKRAADIAREKADAANRAKSIFLTTMSHELRTPLNAILGFAQILESNSREPLSENQKTQINYIINGGNNLLELVNQVLDLNKIEAGGLDLNIDDTPLADIIEGGISLIKTRADQADIEILNQTAGANLRMLRTDREQLTKVLFNLLSNAIKYNQKDGSVILTCEDISRLILRINVKDTGIGIPLEQQSNLFVPFERLGREAGIIEGAGIGLLIAKQIIELLGGEIGFESEAGKGSTFWVDVPLSSQQAFI